MSSQRQAFPRDHRLSGKLAFAAVYAAKARAGRWPLVAYSAPNALGHFRLGLSVPRAVGTAVRRNRIKRLVREAFRLGGCGRGRGLDLVIVIRPHEPKTLGDYQRLLAELVDASAAAWARRQAPE